MRLCSISYDGGSYKARGKGSDDCALHSGQVWVSGLHYRWLGWVYYGIMADVMELGIPRPGTGSAIEHFETRRIGKTRAVTDLHCSPLLGSHHLCPHHRTRLMHPVPRIINILLFSCNSRPGGSGVAPRSCRTEAPPHALRCSSTPSFRSHPRRIEAMAFLL